MSVITLRITRSEAGVLSEALAAYVDLRRTEAPTTNVDRALRVIEALDGWTPPAGWTSAEVEALESVGFDPDRQRADLIRAGLIPIGPTPEWCGFACCPHDPPCRR